MKLSTTSCSKTPRFVCFLPFSYLLFLFFLIASSNSKSKSKSAVDINFPKDRNEENKTNEEQRTWESLVRTTSAPENFSVRRIKKQPRASSQWKLPLWVPTLLRLGLGDPVEKAAGDPGFLEALAAAMGDA